MGKAYEKVNLFLLAYQKVVLAILINYAKGCQDKKNPSIAWHKRIYFCENSAWYFRPSCWGSKHSFWYEWDSSSSPQKKKYINNRGRNNQS